MRYQRVLRLPCDDIRSGIGFKATLDSALKQLVEVLFKPSDGFKIELGDHTGGHLRAIITRGTQKFEVEGCYGQNSTFAEGKKVSFVSYTVRAESELGSTGPAASADENAEVTGKIAGFVLSLVLACALMAPLLKTAKFIYCVPVLVAAAYAGRWFGVKAARTLAVAMRSYGADHASSGKDMSLASAVWKRLIHAIESVTSKYPTA
jgi:hypothetical protein